jgi:hypothetical protein
MKKPKGCKCTVRSWGGHHIRPICNNYVALGNGMCANCEHNKECHEQKKQIISFAYQHCHKGENK